MLSVVVEIFNRLFTPPLTIRTFQGFNIEVDGWPEANGGRSSSSGRRDERLLTEAEYTEPVSVEVQTLEEEGLEWHEDGRNPHPNRWERGEL